MHAVPCELAVSHSLFCRHSLKWLLPHPKRPHLVFIKLVLPVVTSLALRRVILVDFKAWVGSTLVKAFLGLPVSTEFLVDFLKTPLFDGILLHFGLVIVETFEVSAVQLQKLRLASNWLVELRLTHSVSRSWLGLLTACHLLVQEVTKHGVFKKFISAFIRCTLIVICVKITQWC